ncbi:MAG: EAL domain-containing protein [Thermosynechococcaceae cyanobacterium MS004]|nr:EAL domain-containing protein [Thermosynechococcaceae cyanobacterium MS004]
MVNYSDGGYTVPFKITSRSHKKNSSSPQFDAFKGQQSGEYHLLSIEDKQERKILLLESSSYSIGRHAANSIVLNSPEISRHHASLLRILNPKTKKYYFRIVDGDLNGKPSLNGFSINEQRCQAQDLENGDVISFGESSKITYHCISDLAEFRTAMTQVKGVPVPSLVSAALPEILLSPKKTFGDSKEKSTDASDAEHENNVDSSIYRIYSFAELTPNPIIESNFEEWITYANPSAHVQFSDIKVGEKHPLLEGIAELIQDGQRRHGVREIEFEGAMYEQSVHCIVQSQLIRSYFVDITLRKQLEKKLHESEQRYIATTQGANDGLWDWDLVNQRVYFSPRWKAMIGALEKDIGDRPEDWFERVHPLDRDRLRQSLAQHLEHKTQHFECEYRIPQKDGSLRWFLARGLAIWSQDNQAERIAGSQTDITEYYRIREQLTHDALHDPMTGLPNRTLLMDRLDQSIKSLKRQEGHLCALLFLDLDRFKLINDSLGHLAGDQLLVQVSQCLRSCLREEDTVARLGGDEFVVLLNNIQSTEMAIATAKKISYSLNRPFQVGGHEIFTSASIGIAVGGSDYESSEDLLRDADTAMYIAKHSGENRYEIFGSGMRVKAIDQLLLETDLKRALDRQEFSLVYQPIIALKDQQLIGFEALLRWHHPERGVVSPADFIPLAEETGLIIPIGWWVLREACHQVHSWQLQYPMLSTLTISVNISNKQFAQSDFVNKVKSITQDVGINPTTLKLEITEGTVMIEPSAVAAKLKQVKTLGVELMMDDFGTGYSSLNYLRTFPLDTLKVDQSFVDQMGCDDGFEIVKTIINLAHNLKMQVVAEGVEDEVQVRNLEALGCEYAQGYFFSRPLDRSGAETFIQAKALG